MKLGELMKDYVIKPDATGALTNDMLVFAVDISEEKNAEIDEYAVVQGYITGVDASFSPDTVDSQYIRAGRSTAKTGTQASYVISGDRYIGDEFQDFALSHKMIYGVGQEVIVPYVTFNLLNGKGEKGLGTLIVNSNGSGTAGTNSTISVEIRKAGATPEEFQYTPKTTEQARSTKVVKEAI